MTRAGLLTYLLAYEYRTVRELQAAFGLQWVTPMQELIALGLVREVGVRTTGFIAAKRESYGYLDRQDRHGPTRRGRLNEAANGMLQAGQGFMRGLRKEAMAQSPG